MPFIENLTSLCRKCHMGRDSVPLCYESMRALFGVSTDLYTSVKDNPRKRAPNQAEYRKRTASVTRTGLLLNKQVRTSLLFWNFSLTNFLGISHSLGCFWKMVGDYCDVHEVDCSPIWSTAGQNRSPHTFWVQAWLLSSLSGVLDCWGWGWHQWEGEVFIFLRPPPNWPSTKKK